MGHTVPLRFPADSAHVVPYALVPPVSPSGTPGAVGATALAELVRSSRR